MGEYNLNEIVGGKRNNTPDAATREIVICDSIVVRCIWRISKVG